MATLILLSQLGLQRLIGVFSLGVGVFAVATLFLGLNLRVAVRTDREGSIGYGQAIRARVLACVVALPLAVGTMAIASANPQELLVASLLVASRIPDQLSDIVAGFTIRDGRTQQVGRSFLLRGGAALAVISLAWAWGWTVITLAAVLLATAIMVVLAYDILPERRRNRADPPRSMADLIRATWRISPYPGLDSLHLNSFRFALATISGPSFYGLVAICQTLFVPFQIAISSLSIGYVDAARRAHDRGRAELRRHLYLGLLLGGLLGLGFIGTCLFLPDFLVRLLFADQASQAIGPLLVTAIAMSLAPLCGFLSFCVVTGRNRASYVAAPVAGLAIVGLGTMLLMTVDFNSAFEGTLWIAYLFAFSFGVRAILSLWAMRKLIKTGVAG